MARPLNSTAAALLGLLTQGSMSGYDLHQLATERLGDFWTVTRSQVYRELARLARDGRVEAGEAGPRSRRPYAVTRDGRAAFADWVRQEPGAEVIRFPLLLTLTFGEWVGRADLLEFARRQRAAHEQRLAGYLEQDAWIPEGAPPFARATLAFGRHYERAVLAWMDELPTLLADVPDDPDDLVRTVGGAHAASPAHPARAVGDGTRRRTT